MGIWGFVFTFLFSISAFALSDQDIHELQQTHAVRIVGDTLYIRGKLGSHTYDGLALAGEPLKNVKVVEISSFGGNLDWATMVAEKIQKLKVTTRIAKDQVCASACVLIFSAGQKREIHRSSWIGVHGARIGGQYVRKFNQLCLTEDSKYDAALPGCQNFVSAWYLTAMSATQSMFVFFESNGVSKEMRVDYFNMPLDPQWHEQANVIQLPDWTLQPDMARAYNLATDIISE